MDRMRREDNELQRETVKLLTDKLESMQIAQIKSIEAQKTALKTPLPKYNGKPGEFDDWKEGVQNCIKSNNWNDEKRVLGMLLVFLSGQAYRVFNSLTAAQKIS